VASLYAGRVQNVLVDEGSEVKAGDVLAELSSDIASGKVEEAMAGESAGRGTAVRGERAVIHGGMVEGVRCGIIVEITAVARLISGSKVVFIRHGGGRLAKVKQFQRHKAAAPDFVPIGIPLDG